jgi:4-amino-4-deoxy-L-arabinose transferase-like glycosyltransferase
MKGWLGVGLLVRGLMALLLPVGFDEGYYYLYTQHLDWSYFDHPVLVALTTGFGVWLTGQVTPLTIRLGALLLYTGSLIWLYLTSRWLFSGRAAWWSGAIACLIPIFAVGLGVLTLPDAPLMFFWSAAMYVAVVEFFPDPQQSVASYTPSYRVGLLGLLVGLACLSKYHGVALGLGLLGFCLTSRPHRAVLKSPWMLGAIALLLLAIAPILIWNSQHDWVSLRFQSGRAIPNRGYNPLEALGVFSVGLAYLFPSFGLPLWWVCGRSLRRLQMASPTALLLWLALPLMLGLTLMGGYRQILPTWTLPGFWSAMPLLGAAASHWQETSPKGVRRWLWGSAWVIVTLIAIALSHLTLGTLQKPSQYALAGGFLPISADASVQLLDVLQLRQAIAQSPTVMQAIQQADFVFVNEIFLAGQLGMAIAPLAPLPLTCFSDDIRAFAFWSTAEQWLGQTGLYFTSSRQPNPDKYQPYFQQITPVDGLPLRRGGEIIETIRVYRGETMLKPYPRQIGAVGS